MSRYWCFTLNNYTGEDIEQLSSNIEGLDYIVFGQEIGESGTPHLQGYCEMSSNKTINTIKDTLGINRLHVEIAKATYKSLCINYCKKGEQSHEEWSKYQDGGLNFGKNAVVIEKIWKHKQRGKRVDLNAYEMINNLTKEDKTFSEIADFNPEIAIKNHNGIKTLISEHKEFHQKELLRASMEHIDLLPWQADLRLELTRKPHDRKVIWFVDELGGCGKSLMTKWLFCHTNCTMFNNAKTSDIANAWKGERIVIFDLARCLNGEHINFQAIECLKNGMIFSSKYNSCTKVYDRPHIVIFANWPPTDLNALSADKWDIRFLNKDKHGPNPIY